MRGTAPIFTVRPIDEQAVVGELDDPQRVLDQAVVARLRVRRDQPGALVALEDGRYAVTGPLLIAGSRDDVTTYARRRVNTTTPSSARGCSRSSARSRSTSSTPPRFCSLTDESWLR